MQNGLDELFLKFNLIRWNNSSGKPNSGCSPLILVYFFFNIFTFHALQWLFTAFESSSHWKIESYLTFLSNPRLLRCLWPLSFGGQLINRCLKLDHSAVCRGIDCQAKDQKFQIHYHIFWQTEGAVEPTTALWNETWAVINCHIVFISTSIRVPSF